MDKTLQGSAEPFIFDFKQSIDDICEKYGNGSLLDSLAEAGLGYEVMPRAKLAAITESLACLKKNADSLFEDCLSLSARSGPSDEAVFAALGRDHISLIEMLKALE